MATKDNDRIRDLIAAQAADYFVAHRGAELSEEQEQEFLKWLRTSPVHVAEYLAVTELAKDMPGAAQFVSTPLEELIAIAQADDNVTVLGTTATIPARECGRAVRIVRHYRQYAFEAAVAAALVALIVVSGAALWSRISGANIATRNGEQRTLQLSDNTIVRLDSESAISVKFNKHVRIIELLHGQAYFEVAKDAARPFEVHVDSSIIKDIGTTFDVFRKNDETLVTVIEGRVTVRDIQATPRLQRILDEHPDSVADLGAGDQAILLPSGLRSTRRVDLQKATAWTRNEIVFERESVADVAAEFNRYNRTQIVVTDSRIADLLVSGIFHTYDMASFVQFLNGLTGVRVVSSSGTIVVTAGLPVTDLSSSPR
jgi:transmembrane sensor